MMSLMHIRSLPVLVVGWLWAVCGEIPRATAADAGSLSIPADLRRDEVRCGELGCVFGACVTHSLAQQPTWIWSSIRLVPNFHDGRTNGFRMFAIRPGSILSRLGVVNGDSLLALNGVPLSGPEQLTKAAEQARDAPRSTLELSHNGQSYQRLLVLDQSASGEGPAAACPTIPSEDNSPPAPPGQPKGGVASPQSDPAHQALLAEVAKGVRCSEKTCTMRRTLIDQVLANASLWAQSARAIPLMVNGNMQGLKLVSVAPGSLFFLLGLRSGDLVRSFAGHQLTTPESALRAYTELHHAKKVQLSLTRNNAPVVITYLFQT